MDDTAQFLIHHGLPFLFIVVFVEQLGFPIPALPWLLIAGALSASGQFSLPLGITLTVLACLLSDGIWFSLGRYRGRQAVAFLRRFSHEPKSRARRFDNGSTKRGPFGVLLSKFLPGIGMFIPPLAGMSRMNPARFLFMDVIGSLLYAICWLGVGCLFSKQIIRIEAVIARIGISLFVFIVSAVIGYAVYKFVRRTRALTRVPVGQTGARKEASHPAEPQKPGADIVMQGIAQPAQSYR